MVSNDKLMQQIFSFKHLARHNRKYVYAPYTATEIPRHLHYIQSMIHEQKKNNIAR